MNDPRIQLLIGDCREQLRTLPAGSVHCCVTSPPYFGLRDYGTANWDGGDPECAHALPNDAPNGNKGQQQTHPGRHVNRFCAKCGAFRIDPQIGLEPTPDAFVAELVAVFREVRRVLRDDGTLWVNLGDSYAQSNARGGTSNGTHSVDPVKGFRSSSRYTESATISAKLCGVKPKDLIGIPWRVAFALQQPYYTGKVADERDRVWLAAMVDAEGSICGTEYQTGDRTKTNIYISITNTSVQIIDKCERLFPQDIKHVYEKAGPSSRVCYRWDVERMETKAMFLREIYPHLVAKRKQAIVGYTFIELQRGLFSKKKGYLPEQQEQRSWLMAALSKLNAGDDVDLPDWVVEPPSLFEQGFYLRQDIIWHKPNPMPESVRDRCTKSHEYVFLLSKSARYYYDAEAVAEPSVEPWRAGKTERCFGPANPIGTMRNDTGREVLRTDARNKRSVWTVATAPFPGSHFATFPPALIEPCILAGCPEGVCTKCGTPIEPETFNEIRLRGMQEGIRGPSVSRGPQEILQQALHEPSKEKGEADCELSSVRQSLFSNEGRTDGELLQQEVRIPPHGENERHDQGQVRDESRLHSRLPTGASGSVNAGVRHGTSACDGGDDRAPASERGSRASSGREPTEQHAEQSGIDAQAASRPSSEGKNGHNRVPSLRRRYQDFASCKSCGSDLSQIGAISPGVCLDPFGGSGTTAGVAIKHGRRAILCELNPAYAAMVDERVRSIAEYEFGLFAEAVG